MQSLLTSLWWTQFAAWKARVTSLASDNYPQEIDWDGLPRRLGSPSCLLYFFLPGTPGFRTLYSPMPPHYLLSQPEG